MPKQATVYLKGSNPDGSPLTQQYENVSSVSVEGDLVVVSMSPPAPSPDQPVRATILKEGVIRVEEFEVEGPPPPEPAPAPAETPPE